MTDTSAPLRRDIRLLGAILGQVLVEQEGPSLLETVERIRRASRAARRDGSVAAVEHDLSAETQALVLRAFGVFFQLANLAEQLHRVRRRRDDARHGRAVRESLRDAFKRVAREDLDAARNSSIRLVLTSHPTEATRRTVLLTHLRIARQLQRLDDPGLPPEETDDAEERIAEEITLLWQADEVRHDRLRITDEIRNGLWFFEHSLMEAAEELTRDWRKSFPDAPPPLQDDSRRVVSKDDLRRPGPSAQFGDRTAFHQPAPMHPNKQFRLDAFGELPDRAPHQVGPRRSVDCDIFVFAADALDLVDRNAGDSTGTSQPEFMLVG